MISKFDAWAVDHRDELHALLRKWFELERPLLLRSDLLEAFDVVRDSHPQPLVNTPLHELVKSLQEAVCRPPLTYLSLREGAGHWSFLRIHQQQLVPEIISVSDYLAFKELLVRPDSSHEPVLELDFTPFNRDFPRLTETRSIGQGVMFLNRQLSGTLFTQSGIGAAKLLHFLTVHNMDGQQLMLHGNFANVAALRTGLRHALGLLDAFSEDAPWQTIAEPLSGLGFAPGWGNHVKRVIDTMSLLVDILEAASPEILENFLARIPMISKLLILSPHGYFGQNNVLGMPDTGGQGELARRIEPRSPTPDSRLRALARLRDAGIETGVNCMPVLPGITDDPVALDALVRRVAEAGAVRIGACALRLDRSARLRYLPFIEQEFPELADRYHASYSHDRNVGEKYRAGLAQHFDVLRAKYGIGDGSRY